MIPVAVISLNIFILPFLLVFLQHMLIEVLLVLKKSVPILSMQFDEF